MSKIALPGQHAANASLNQSGDFAPKRPPGFVKINFFFFLVLIIIHNIIESWLTPHTDIAKATPLRQAAQGTL
jgi:hypothetical protein